ncbi:MAG: type IV pili twitching motility protein PilT [Firmicutes bacterium HGW-Firmicutes-3]|jgi:twitching motility protein PilT|nr:MAG: type IV pili twitching motility protein PilT [Firmicutes bacterium HGW-Firmicutes-3]
MDNYTEFMDHLLEETMKYNATDLHLCAGSKPLIRVNSRLRSIENTDILKPETMRQIVGLYLNEKQLEILNEKKTLDMSYSKRDLGRFRCNFYLQRGTFALAIRSLPLVIPDLEALGLPGIAADFLEKNKGLVLITGSTGSGKSTTLASMIKMINERYHYHITTIEDPVEYLHKHEKSMVTQKEIGSDALSFSGALKSALREDPDVIMLGEMRDMDTISIALTAAETGHLVLSTLHTNGAVKAVDRILDAFPTEQQNQVKSQLATVLEGVISQQLVPRKDHKGLVLASEIMAVTPAVRNLIREGKQYQINNLIQNGMSQGMRSLERNLVQLCHDNIIDYQEARLRAQDIQLFDAYFDVLN